MACTSAECAGRVRGLEQQRDQLLQRTDTLTNTLGSLRRDYQLLVAGSVVADRSNGKAEQEGEGIGRFLRLVEGVTDKIGDKPEAIAAHQAAERAVQAAALEAEALGDTVSTLRAVCRDSDAAAAAARLDLEAAREETAQLRAQLDAALTDPGAVDGDGASADAAARVVSSLQAQLAAAVECTGREKAALAAQQEHHGAVVADLLATQEKLTAELEAARSAPRGGSVAAAAFSRKPATGDATATDSVLAERDEAVQRATDAVAALSDARQTAGRQEQRIEELEAELQQLHSTEQRARGLNVRLGSTTDELTVARAEVDHYVARCDALERRAKRDRRVLEVGLRAHAIAVGPAVALRELVAPAARSLIARVAVLEAERDEARAEAAAATEEAAQRTAAHEAEVGELPARIADAETAARAQYRQLMAENKTLRHALREATAATPPSTPNPPTEPPARRSPTSAEPSPEPARPQTADVQVQAAIPMALVSTVSAGEGADAGVSPSPQSSVTFSPPGSMASPGTPGQGLAALGAHPSVMQFSSSGTTPGLGSGLATPRAGSAHRGHAESGGLFTRLKRKVQEIHIHDEQQARKDMQKAQHAIGAMVEENLRLQRRVEELQAEAAALRTRIEEYDDL